MAKIDVKFMKGNAELAKAMGSTYTKKKVKTTTRVAKTGKKKK